MVPTISQVCSLAASFETDVQDYAASGCQSIDIWLTKLETYLQQHDAEDAKRLLQESGLDAPVASFQGGLLTPDATAREQARNLFESRLEICRDLQIETIVVAIDMAGPVLADTVSANTVLADTVFANADTVLANTVQQLPDRLEQIGASAASYGVRVALEFQAGNSFCNNLQTLAALIAQVDHPHLGICLDTFHFFHGPSKVTDLQYLSAENLFHVQVSDVSGALRELATDADRILPGDGELELSAIVERLRQIAYDGPVALELMNPILWQVPPRELSDIGMQTLQRMLEDAEHQALQD